jgi:hypothetical protein
MAAITSSRLTVFARLRSGERDAVDELAFTNTNGHKE